MEKKRVSSQVRPGSSNAANRKLLTLPTGAWVLPWIVPAVVGVRLKWVMMVQSGYEVTAESLGKTNGFGFWEKLSFFRMDVTVAVLGAVVLLIVGGLLPRRLRLPFVSGVSAGVTLALYMQLRAFRTVGQFLSFRMFWIAITWGLHEPGAYASYLGIKRPLIISAVGVTLLLATWRLLSKRVHRIQVPRQPRMRLTGGVATLDLILYCLIPVLGVFTLPRLPSSPYRSSVLLRALSAYWQEGQKLPTGEFASLDTAGLLARYREINHAPEPEKNPRYWGKAEGSNVLFFVLETMPARFLQPAGNMDDLPNLRLLRERSFVGLSHYTTFPRTHESAFSLLSSWYPLEARSAFGEEHTGLRVPGIMATLSARGYYTAIYSPMRGGAMPDEEMFREVGVQNQVYPPGSLAPPPGNLRDEWQRNRIARDLTTLDLMRQDLEQRISNHRNFAAVFFPQISHLPYPDVPQNEHDRDIRKRARGILEVEDGWLGQVMELLQQYRELDNTIIVVVGDHGIRSRQEDPNFVPGMIDEYSFHVPLLIYAPKALDRPVMIPWPTSHIDVAPTVLDLLGVEEGRKFEEGSPVWDARLADRTTYFFAEWMFGADGYYSDHHFYMRSVMSGGVYASPDMHFHTSDIVSRDSVEYERVSAPLARMEALQRVAAAHFAPANRVRDHIFEVALPQGTGRRSSRSF